MRKFKRIWAWEDTIKKMDNIRLPNETKAELLDKAIRRLDNSIIIESRQERAARLMSH